MVPFSMSMLQNLIFKLFHHVRLSAWLPVGQGAGEAYLRSVQAYSTILTTDPGRAPLRSRDRLEKRGLSQSLIQPIPADLRAQIRTGEGDEEEEEEEEGRHAHEELLLAPTGHVCGWWFVVSFLRDALDCNPRQFYTSPSPAMARRNQRSESVETGGRRCFSSRGIIPRQIGCCHRCRH